MLEEKVGVLEEKLEKETIMNKIELDRKLQMLEKKFEKKIKIRVLKEKICTLETTKTKMGEKIYMLEKSHEKKILELEKKMCSLMASGPSIHPSFLSKLANATPRDQKQMLGDRLFPIICNISRDDDQATKIINHLLGSENQQLLLMLEDYDYLLNRIKNLKN